MEEQNGYTLEFDHVNFLIELVKLRHEFNLVSVSLSLFGNPALMFEGWMN
jgi:hypothetical protein